MLSIVHSKLMILFLVCVYVVLFLNWFTTSHIGLVLTVNLATGPSAGILNVNDCIVIMCTLIQLQQPFEQQHTYNCLQTILS